MNNYRLLSLSDEREWSAYLQKLPDCQRDVYYTPEYYRLYEKLGDGKLQCFVFMQDDKLALYPFLLNSVNNLGYSFDMEYYDLQGAYGYNGVVSSSFDPDFIDAFYQAFDKWCIERNVIAEFTRFHPLLRNQCFSTRHMKIFFDR